MYLAEDLRVLENSDPERFHNVIVNIFDMSLEGALMIPQHTLAQLKTRFFLKVAAPIRSQIQIYRAI